MRKLYLSLMALSCNLLMQAQSTPSVNFSFVVDPSTKQVSFTNKSINLGEGVKKAFWNFGDGTVAVSGATEGISHQFKVAGNYQVCLNVYRFPADTKDSVLIGSECKPVEIRQACTAGLQWRDSLAVPSQIHYTRFVANAESNATKIIKQVCWKFGDGTDTCINVASTSSIASYLNLTHRYQQAGTYNACVRVVFDGGCVAEKCESVNVPATTISRDSCSANFTARATNATALGRRFVAQVSNSQQKKPLRICWNFGDGKDTCIQYTSSYTGDYCVEHNYTHGGQYEACVVIKYDGGCESKRCNTVSIEEPTPVSCEALLQELATQATNLERKFYVGLQNNKTAENICWKFGDGSDTCVVLSTPLNAKQLAISHRYAAPGNYTVCARVVYSGRCVAERCRPVEISTPRNSSCSGYFTDSVVAVNKIRFSAFSIHEPNDHIAGYLWTFGDGNAASEQQPTHEFSAPGTYAVSLMIRTDKGCETKLTKRIVIAGDAKPLLTLTPNPVISNMSAVFQSLFHQNVSVKIYNSNGILIKTYDREAMPGLNTWTFSLGGLQTGTYSVVVQSSNQFASNIFFKL